MPERRTSRRARRSGRTLVLAVVGAATLVGVLSVGLAAASSLRGTASGTASSAAILDTPAADDAVTDTPTTDAAESSSAGVGVVTVSFVDESRTTPARGGSPASSSRALTVTIRYPAIAAGTDVVDATPVAGSFPLVVFVHGFGVSAETYADMERDLAVAGFVVAAADFPLSSSALAGTPVRDIVEQAADVSFFITMLLGDSTAPPLLRDSIAAAPVAVIGHSDGGVTAAGVAFADGYADPRVGAAVVLSGAEAFFPGSWFGGEAPALLAIHGLADAVNPFAASERLYDDATGPRLLVGVEGGAHLEPFTTDAVRTRISTLVADFLHATLDGDQAAAARIATDAGSGGLVLVED